MHEEIDFSAKVTRVEFEEMCADLFDRIAEPVKQALKISEITMVSLVILVVTHVLSDGFYSHRVRLSLSC